MTYDMAEDPPTAEWVTTESGVVTFEALVKWGGTVTFADTPPATSRFRMMKCLAPSIA